MGVYNPWADSPVSCCACDFRYKCPLFNETTYALSYFKHPDCPLVEIEVPHGRLIDADAVTREMIADIGKRSIRIDTAITVLEAEGKDDG